MKINEVESRVVLEFLELLPVAAKIKASGWRQLNVNGGVLQNISEDIEGIELHTDGHIAQICLDDMGMRGVFPTSIVCCSHLTSFSAKGNSLNGPIPDGLMNCVSLTSLSLGNGPQKNLISGPIPLKIGNLVSLKNLELGGNSLSG
jgi:hypothetical protein